MKSIQHHRYILVSGATGFISLSQEILWIRLLEFFTGSSPQVFGYTLAALLIGVAGGALLTPIVIARRKLQVVYVISDLLAFSGAVFYFSPLLIGLASIRSPSLAYGFAFAMVGAVAFFNGGIFPLVCAGYDKHIQDVATTITKTYLANIIGAAAGPLVTAFLILEYFSLERAILLITLLSLSVAVLNLLWSTEGGRLKTCRLLTVAVGVAAAIGMYNPVYADLVIKLQLKNQYEHGDEIVQVAQNRQGIITVSRLSSESTDTIFGNGMYDGKFNIDPVSNENWITRAYMIPALNRRSENVLMIGLGSGSWARVLASHARLKKLTIVEINPGYLDIIRNYPEFADVLDDTRIDIIIDDGRHWLRRNTDQKFDVIVGNLTFHWRSNTTHLSSSEFMRLAKSHLNCNGLLYLNTTDSPYIIRTAVEAFKHVVSFGNFVAASDHPFDLTARERIRNLLLFSENMAPFFTVTPEREDVMKELAEFDLPEISAEMLPDTSVITDDNMVAEFERFRREKRNYRRPDHRILAAIMLDRKSFVQSVKIALGDTFFERSANRKRIHNKIFESNF